MKRGRLRLSPAFLLVSISGLISALICGILLLVIKCMAGAQDTQNMAERWSYSEENRAAQVSVFFSENRGVTENEILFFEHGLDSALVEASITNTSTNPDSRLWIDSYSATGTITLERGDKNVSVSAIGVGGEFFQFHPLKLVSGAYFSGNDVMQDYCVVDEEVAWQLFGSNDIAGQIITIKGVPHIITGVIERQQDRLSEAAGLKSSVVYVSYNTLVSYGRANSICCYEIVMPNPVKNFAFNYVKEELASDEAESEIIENTSRYGLISLLQTIGEFGTRSMNGKAIIYPYWENVARGYEDILATLLFVALLFFLYPFVLVIVALRRAWVRRTWTSKSVYLKLKDKWERFLEKLRAKKLAKKEERRKDKEFDGLGVIKVESRKERIKKKKNGKK
ncbi:MAG: ABC transporter permease [Lachnospiraceae bacterium]|nr:ABC transporter permease [Lachnospiraceae bacterium]MBQ9123149.1 ABC transporter permease [Lachnospiraceae bacterium]